MPAGAARNHSAPGPARGRPRVLLAEDDPIASAIIEQKLSGKGMDVVAFGDGREALEAVLSGLAGTGARGFDLLILDVSLPGLDGFEVLAGIRAREELKGIPVMMLTGK